METLFLPYPSRLASRCMAGPIEGGDSASSPRRTSTERTKLVLIGLGGGGGEALMKAGREERREAGRRGMEIRLRGAEGSYEGVE